MRISLARLMGRTMTFGGALANGLDRRVPAAPGGRGYLYSDRCIIAIIAASVGIVYYMLRRATSRIADGRATSEDAKVVNATDAGAVARARRHEAAIVPTMRGRERHRARRRQG